jgi:hypothetical protein
MSLANDPEGIHKKISDAEGGMARNKVDKPSTSGIFKKIFAEHPELLGASNLDSVIELFQRENPNVEVTPKIRQIAANIKSTLKKKGAGGANPGGPALERLEDKIDSCIALAKEISVRDLRNVIWLLRRARNGARVVAGRKSSFPTPGTPEWGGMNRRRWELIQKKARAPLTAQEQAEFDLLQQLSLEAVEQAFPRPASDVIALHELEAELRGHNGATAE